MRKLPPRAALPKKVREKLAEKTRRIEQAVDRQKEAERAYDGARQRKWFHPIVKLLRDMAGTGERCMLCSGSESSEVEHFKPKTLFPELAMTWENFLWSCGICNRYKGGEFPRDVTKGDSLINPIDEYVWDFFSLDQFGLLTPRWRLDLNDFDPRALVTYALLRLDRQALQESRRHRRQDLVRSVEDSLARHRAGELTVADLSERKQAWLVAPFQPDVADYYLNGPGRTEEPFTTFLSIVEQP